MQANDSVFYYGNNFIDFGIQEPLMDIIEASMEKYGPRVAIVDEAKRITYTELSSQVNKMTNYLRSVGVEKDSVICIYADREIDTIVCMLSIIKCGAVFLPVDISTPLFRLKQICMDSNTFAILAKGLTQEDINFVKLIEINEKIYAGEIFDNICSTHSKYAYMMFTSGSTGRPKGVMVRKDSLINLIYGLNHVLYGRYEKNMNVALISSFAFDASIKMIFPSIVFGHTLNIVPERTRFSGRKLVDFYYFHKIGITDGTPSHIKILINSAERLGKQLCIKHFLIGGEVLTVDLVKSIYMCKWATKTIITNLYGPTECCVDATYYSIDTSTPLKTSIPIGRPMPNCRILILDDSLNLLPLNSIGEIYISGISVADGYIGERQMSVFMDNPFVSGERMYKTGDKGYWCSDGNIMYCGRSDSQVKIRGYRIELAEIEMTIKSLAFVGDALVTTNTDEGNSTYIVAYIQARKAMKSEDVDVQLKKSLPHYMVPQKYIFVDAFSLNQNGKKTYPAMQ